MKRLRLILLLLLGFCTGASGLLAQFTVAGTVTDENNEPLIGATILQKGTSSGTVTDLDGSFRLDVSRDPAVLVFSYTGYKSKELTVNSASPSLEVVMEPRFASLSEVVVVGYGQSRKEALTGSVSTLGSEQLEQVPVASVEQTLQGNVAGLQATTSNGQPGSNASIRIRGQGSISASSEPLYVIDGIPVISGSLSNNSETSNPLTSINPNDLESVTVLKDAAATAIYGARGANGVILINTKSGKSGQAKVALRTQYGFNDWAVNESRRLRGLTAREYTELYIEGYENRGEDITTILNRFNNQYPGAVDFGADGTIQQINIDNRWIDQLTRTGINQSYDMSVSGGTDKMTYYASGSYFDQEAPVIYSSLDRYSGRVNLDVQATDRLKLTNNLSVSRVKQQGMNDGTRWANPLYNGYLLAPVIPARNEQGQFYDGHKGFFMGGNNPIGSLSGDDTQEWVQLRVIESVTGSYEIADNLFFKSAWSFDMLNFDEFYFRNARYGDGRNANGIGAETTRRQLSWIGTQTLNYSTSVGENNNLDFLAGYETTKTDRRSVFATAENYPNPALRTLASASSPTTASSNLIEYAFESFFGQVAYNYDYKYYLSGSLRRDGSSRFGVDNRYGTFWSVGASWRLSEEDFLKDSGLFQNLKLRASYGITGNAGIGNYDAIPTFSFSGVDYDGNPGGAPGQIGNNALTWEQASNFNIGLDFELLNRLSGTIEYFQRDNDDLLLDLPVSRTTGFTQITQNFGSMRNNGVEITLNADIINQSDFSWSLGGNISFLKNQITKLPEEFIGGTKLRREGEDFQSFYLFGWAGVDQANGAPLFYTDSTQTETTSDINQASRYLTGQTATPSSFGGLSTSLRYKGLTLDAQFVFSFDNWLYDATAWVSQGDGRFTPRSQTNLVLNRWQQPGDVTDVPRFEWGNRSGSNTTNTTRWIHDGSYVRLRNVTLAYSLPNALTERLRMSNIRVYARGLNLLTWTRDKDLYLDPEAAFSGVVNSPVPNLRNISFGLDVTF